MDDRKWECKACTLINSEYNSICEACSSERPKKADSVIQSHRDSRSYETEFLYRGCNERQTISSGIDASELRVVIIGKTGTGKSATGNTILGHTKFDSKVSGGSVTRKCNLGITTRTGRKFVVVDTPGLFDTEMTNEDVTKEIVKCIGMTAPGPHAVLLTVNVGRFTKEEQDTVKHFVNHFGEGMYRYLIVVFTRADDLENDNISIKDYVNNSPPALKEILNLSGKKYIPFNNKLYGHRQEQQVIKLVTLVDEVIRQNGGSHYTNEMFLEAEKTFQRRQIELKATLQEKERQEREALQKELQQEFEKKLQDSEREKNNLAAKITAIENERQRAGTNEALIKKEMKLLQNELRSCLEKNEKRNDEILRKVFEEGERREAEIKQRYEDQMRYDSLRNQVRTEVKEEKGVWPKILDAVTTVASKVIGLFIRLF